MSKNKSGIKNIVKELRNENDQMSQTELARRVGVSRQTIVSIEKGSYSPSLELAFRIAYVFDKSIETVFMFDKTVMKGN